MKTTFSLFAFALLLPLPARLQGEEAIAAQPVMLTAGTTAEVDHFFPTSAGGADYVAFFKSKPLPGGTMTQQTLCEVLVRSGESFFATVDRPSPLRAVAKYVLPTGTSPANFLASETSGDSTLTREVFRLPGRGLFQMTNGAAPALLRPETLAHPITGVALQFPAAYPNSVFADRQYRVIFGATDPRKGTEPFVSAGTMLSTRLLTDIAPGASAGKVPYSSQPEQFTTYAGDVCFVTVAEPSFAPAIQHVTYDSTSKPPVNKAVLLLSTVFNKPDHLTGSGAGLFLAF